MAIFDNLFGAPPEYLTGLLGADETDKLRKQALTTGLVNSAIALIAQPRNQRFGSALPYIGRALMAGQQAGQGVYNSALQGLETQQKLAEFKRKQEQQQQLQTMLGNIQDPNERLYAQIAPEQYVAGKVKPAPAQAKLLTKEEQVAQGLPETGRYQMKPDGSYELVSGTAPKEAPSMTDEPSRVAFAKFNKPLNQLTPQEMAQVNQYIESRQVRVAGAGVPSQAPSFKDAGELRKEYNANPQIKAFAEVQNAFDQIKTGIEATSAAGDLTAATKFMKLLDPGSVVRESELGMAMAATGVLDRALAYKDYIAKGTKLSPMQREDFLNVATQLYNAAKSRKDDIENQYSEIAQVGGLDPKLVIGNPQTSGGSLQERIMKIKKQRQGGKK
jgi:cell fate (sporulation/competence/biofilm development) regulator YlbF (YheA/YmcA/DUF963 family)